MAIAEFAPRHAGINVEPPAAARNTWKPVTATPGSTWVSKSFRAPVAEPPMEAFDSGAVVEALFDPNRPDPEAERRQVLDAINDALTRFNLANDDTTGRQLRSLGAELSANAISTAQARMELDGYVARLQRQNPAAGFSAIDAFRAVPSSMPSEPSPATPVVPNLFAPTPWRATLLPQSTPPRNEVAEGERFTPIPEESAINRLDAVAQNFTPVPPESAFTQFQNDAAQRHALLQSTVNRIRQYLAQPSHPLSGMTEQERDR